MKRYTKRHGNDRQLTNSELSIYEDLTVGSIIERLQQYEDFHEDLVMEHTLIINQLQKLRDSDRKKTVSFRQLFSNKVMTEMLMERLQRYVK